MTGSIFLAILGVALGFSAGFAIGSIWTDAGHRRRANRRDDPEWFGVDCGSGDHGVRVVWSEADEIERLLKAAREKPLNLNITTETDNDHRPR